VNPVVPHQYLSREYTIKEAGYAFVYVSNENATLVDVYFDDVTMTHTKGNVIQYNEYYPFGMQTANSWTRENTTGNNFLANGGTELNTTSNLYDLAYRNYDPVLGRMNGVDPMASKYSSLTPYNFSFNDPVTFADPSGADPADYYFYGGYFTYDDWIPQRDMGWQTSLDRSGAGKREFGVSLAFGNLSYSAAGQALNAQMVADARAVHSGSMSHAQYGARYGEGFTGTLTYERHRLSGTYSVNAVNGSVTGYTWSPPNLASTNKLLASAGGGGWLGDNRPSAVNMFQSDQKVLDGLASHMRFYSANGRSSYHLSYIVQSIKPPPSESKMPSGAQIVKYLANYYSSMGMSLFERSGKGKILGQHVEFIVTVVINTAEMEDRNWVNLEQNRYLGIANPNIGDFSTRIFMNSHQDRLVILKFYSPIVGQYLDGN
jgi:RHS repeat-associated protein